MSKVEISTETLIGLLSSKDTPKASPSADYDYGPSIVIADRGWVWQGHAMRQGDDLLIKNARCVRRYGQKSKQGLAYAAKEGPGDGECVLEAACDTRVPYVAVKAILPCEASKWNA